MIIIADSGSTKCDWVVLSPAEQPQLVHTMGLNPYFHSASFMAEQILNEPYLQQISKQINAVYFYGAGNSSDDLKKIVTNGLQLAFKNAKIHADHDLVGAAYATYKGEPCISAIIGTGSNSCFFDGKEIYEEVPALAYILGDEGSGSYFGKKLLADYLYKRLPKQLTDYLQNELELDKQKIIQSVYMKPHANVYLASYVRTLAKFKNLPYVDNLLREGINKFLDIHICCYNNFREIPTHFIGSVAFHFQDILIEEAEKLGVKIGTVTKQPIFGLVNYHLKYVIENAALYQLQTTNN